MGLDAAEHDEVVGAARAHDLEVVGRPRHLAGLAVDELDGGALLGEVVERIGIDLTDRERAVGELGEGRRRRAGDVEPAGEPDQQDRGLQRRQLVDVECQHLVDSHATTLRRE
jgi:hypothetical protein